MFDLTSQLASKIMMTRCDIDKLPMIWNTK